MRSKRSEELRDLPGVGTVVEGEEGPRGPCQGDVGSRETVAEAAAAHQDVVHGPRADAAQGGQALGGAGGGPGRQRLEVEPAGDGLRRLEQVLGLAAGELEADQVGGIDGGEPGRRRVADEPGIEALSQPAAKPMSSTRSLPWRSRSEAQVTRSRCSRPSGVAW